VSQLDDYCKDKGFVGWFETSAKDNIGIDEAARCLVAKILENDESIDQQSQDKDILQITETDTKKKRQCC
jgi:Ras-related protein Rab-32